MKIIIKRFKSWLIRLLGGITPERHQKVVDLCSRYQAVAHNLLDLRKEKYTIVPVRSYLSKRDYEGKYPGENPIEIMYKLLSRNIANYILSHDLLEIKDEDTEITATVRVAVKK